jgi:hypothetical protein
MARSVTFNGVTKFGPGGITKINANALNQVGVSAANVVGLIGESDGGIPGATSGLVSLRDPAQSIDLFRSGPLVDAIRLAFESSGDPDIPGGAGEVVVYKVNASTQSSIHVPDHTGTLISDTAAGTGSTTTVDLVTGGLVINAHVDRWVDVTHSALPGTPTVRRRIVSNTATQLTITPAMPATAVVTDVVTILPTLYTVTSSDYGAHTEGITIDLTRNDTTGAYQTTVTLEGVDQVSESIGGNNYLQLYYRGGPLDVAQTTISTSANTTTTFFDVDATLVATNHADMSVVVTNPATGNFEQHKISTNGTGDVTLTAPGFSADFLTEVQAATDSTVTVDIISVTAATAQITGASGLATAFVTTITGVAGDNLALTIGATDTLQNLVDSINQNSNYLATVPDGVNAQTALASAFDFGVAAINIQRSIAVNGGLGFRQDLAQLVAWYNTTADQVDAARYTVAAADGAALPLTAALTDALFLDPFLLLGGARGSSSNSNWQTAFDTMLLRKIDNIVPLIDEDLANEGLGSTATWASVSAQLVDHVVTGRGAAGLERGGFIGFQGTKLEYIAACNSLNDQDVACVSQNPTVLDATGTLTVKAPREFAVMASSMRSGVQEVGEPLTHKFIRTSTLTQDATWDPRDLTDIADLVLAGALFAEVVPGLGVRWVRDLTTWVKDDNLAYSEGSVRSVVRFVAYELRTLLEDRYTGKKATPATIASVKDTAVTLLEGFRSDNIIVDSEDPATGVFVRAYHNLKVFTTGDILKLNVGIFPVPGINFQLTEIFLQLPTQSA